VVTTVGFFGFLVGPVVIGMVSKFFGLPIALALVVILGLLTAICAPLAVQTYLLSQSKIRSS
jgi:predicted permease